MGLDEFGEIVDIGAGTVGYVDSEISDEFREIFSAHDFIISKGMGNYEGLTEIDLSSKEVFFFIMFQVYNNFKKYWCKFT